MTPDERRAALVEKMARALCIVCDPDAPGYETGMCQKGSAAGRLPAWTFYVQQATAALSLALEEAAECAGRPITGASLTLASGERVEVSPHMVEFINSLLRRRAFEIRALIPEK